MKVTKYVLDTNCFVDAARDEAHRAAFTRFCEAAAPGLHLSAVVAAELRAGVRDSRARRTLDVAVLAPYVGRGRVLTPSAWCWDRLGTVLGTLAVTEGLRPADAPRTFLFDILIAQSCREAGAVLVSRNARDLARIARVAPFEFVAPYPSIG